MIADDLEEVLRWVDGALPGGRASLQLRPGAGDAELAAYAEALGVRLPDDLVALWRIHDGQEDACEVDFLPERWLPVRESRAMRSDQLRFVVHDASAPAAEGKLLDCVFHAYRLPLASSALFDHWVSVDLAPGPEGTVGQVIVNVSECDFAVLGTGVGEVLARYAALARDGALRYDADLGVRAGDVSLWTLLAG